MSARLPLFLCACAVLLTCQAAFAVNPVSTHGSMASANAGQHHNSAKKKRSSHHHLSARLVPPPPAYMPTILPELYYRQHSPVQAVDEEEEDEVASANADKKAVAAKPKYVQYFSYAPSTRKPKAVQARSGVTVWATTAANN